MPISMDQPVTARSAIPRRGAIAVATFLLAGLAPGLPPGLHLSAVAQGLTSAFGGFAASPDQPIDIQANRLDINDKTKRAVFSGQVVAVQDTFTMNSNTLEVHYAARSGAKKKARATPGLGGGSTEITRLVARGKVFIRSAKQNAQTATGNWAEFDVRKRIITMGDVVTLKQGNNVIRGTRLVINLNTGRSSVLSGTAENPGKKGGRIRMVITPNKAIRSQLGKPPAGRRKNRGRVSGTTSASRPVRATRGDQ